MDAVLGELIVGDKYLDFFWNLPTEDLMVFYTWCKAYREARRLETPVGKEILEYESDPKNLAALAEIEGSLYAVIKELTA